MDRWYEIDGHVYSLRDEMKNEKFYPPSYLLMLINYEYYTDDVLYEIWGGCDDGTYYKMDEYTKLLMTSLINYGMFNWEEYVIDENCRDVFKQLEIECHKIEETNDYSKIGEILINYFEGTDEFRYKNTSPIVDYIMAMFSVVVSRNNAMKGYDYDFCRTLYKETRETLQEQLDELKARILQNKI